MMCLILTVLFLGSPTTAQFMWWLPRNLIRQSCDNRGEHNLDDSVATCVYGLAEEAVRRNALIEIVRYAA